MKLGGGLKTLVNHGCIAEVYSGGVKRTSRAYAADCHDVTVNKGGVCGKNAGYQVPLLRRERNHRPLRIF